MSAFHRIDDVRVMPALRFINFAMRLAAYKGIVRALAEREEHDRTADSLPAAARPAPRAQSAPQTGGDVRRDRVVASDAATLMTDPAFAGMFEPKRSANA